MSGIEIRKMRPADLSPALAILAHWNMAPIAPSAAVPNPVRQGLNVETTFVAESDGKIVGLASYILLGRGYAETASLAVHPSWTGRGIGTRLTVARMDELRRLGIRRLRTEADRPETIAWYVRKFGYRVLGTIPKRHAFSLAEVGRWTVLELDLTDEGKD